MAIKFIINGYFRSGTTFIWDAVKSSSNIDIFYEPLHPHLPGFLNNNQKIDILHSKNIWSEYSKLDFNEKINLCRSHPNINDLSNYNDSGLTDYYNIFNSLDFDCALQLNRAHFHLDLFKNYYDAKLIHIIRNPLDIYNSIEKVCMGKKGLEKLIYILYRKYKMTSCFEINKDFHWIKTYIGKPQSVYNIKNKFTLFFSTFEKFVIIWTLSNYYAIKSLEFSNGLVLAYEELNNNKEKFVGDLKEYLDINTEIVMDVKLKNLYNYNKLQWEKFTSIVSKYNLEDEFNYILNYLKKNRDINYNDSIKK